MLVPVHTRSFNLLCPRIYTVSALSFPLRTRAMASGPGQQLREVLASFGVGDSVDQDVADYLHGILATASSVDEAADMVTSFVPEFVSLGLKDKHELLKALTALAGGKWSESFSSSSAARGSRRGKDEKAAKEAGTVATEEELWERPVAERKPAASKGANKASPEQHPRGGQATRAAPVEPEETFVFAGMSGSSGSSGSKSSTSRQSSTAGNTASLTALARSSSGGSTAGSTLSGSSSSSKLASASAGAGMSLSRQSSSGGGSSAPAAASSSSSPSPHVATLMEMMPGLTQEQALYALGPGRGGGSLDAAAAYLLEGTVQEDMKKEADARAKAEEKRRLEAEAEAKAHAAAKKALLNRWGEMPDTSDKTYKPTLPTATVGGRTDYQAKRALRYRDGETVMLPKGEKYMVETVKQEDPSTFVSLKIKKKGQGGAGPGWSK